MNITGWWYTYPPEKYARQLGWWHSQYIMKKNHVPNHQPDIGIQQGNHPLVICYIAIENGSLTVDLPIPNGDFP